MHFKGQEIIAEVSIGAELPPQKLGTLTSRNKSLCWDEVWSNKILKKSEEVFEQVILQCDAPYCGHPTTFFDKLANWDT